MRICNITNFFPPVHQKFGGAEQAAKRIFELQLDNGLESFVLTTVFKKKHSNVFGVKRLDNYFGILGTLFKSIFPFDLISFFQIRKYLKRENPDIVHLHKFDAFSLSAISAAKSLGLPIIHSIYDYDAICPTAMLLKSDNLVCKQIRSLGCAKCVVKRKAGILRSLFLPFTNLFYRYIFQNIDRFIVLSSSSKAILKRFGISGSKIDIVYLPFDEPKIPHVKQDKDSLLYVGWLEPHKGAHILISAMPFILKKFKHAKLNIVGSGDSNPSYFKSVKSLVKDLDLEKSVSLLGRLGSGEFRSLLVKSNIVLIPEQWENMSPLFLIESMSYGKAIVASDIGGLPEFIVDGKNGYLVNPSDSRAFAEKIIDLLQNPSKAHKFGSESKKVFLTKFNKGSIFSSLLSSYGSVENAR